MFLCQSHHGKHHTCLVCRIQKPVVAHCLFPGRRQYVPYSVNVYNEGVALHMKPGEG